VEEEARNKIKNNILYIIFKNLYIYKMVISDVSGNKIMVNNLKVQSLNAEIRRLQFNKIVPTSSSFDITSQLKLPFDIDTSLTNFVGTFVVSSSISQTLYSTQLDIYDTTGKSVVINNLTYVNQSLIIDLPYTFNITLNQFISEGTFDAILTITTDYEVTLTGFLIYSTSVPKGERV
jgi:hypothetical protein